MSDKKWSSSFLFSSFLVLLGMMLTRCFADATFEDVQGRLYPTVRFKNTATVKANFTGKKEPFKYKIEEYISLSEAAMLKHSELLENDLTA
jgi:hypothetical protein